MGHSVREGRLPLRRHRSHRLPRPHSSGEGLFALEETSGKKRGLNPLSTRGLCIAQSLC